MATKKINANAKRSRTSVKNLRAEIFSKQQQIANLITSCAALEQEAKREKERRESLAAEHEKLKERIRASSLLAGPGKLISTTLFGLNNEFHSMVHTAQKLGHFCVVSVVENLDQNRPEPLKLELWGHERHLPPVGPAGRIY